MGKLLWSMRSVIVTKELLEKIEKCISRNLGSEAYEISYLCKAVDGSEHCFSSAQEMDDCDNSLKRAFKSMKISVNSELLDECWIIFERLVIMDVFATPITVFGRISSEQKDISDLYNDIKYQIDRYSRGRLYSFLSNAGISFTLPLIIMLARIYVQFFGMPTTYSIPLFGIADAPLDPSTFWGKVIPYAKVYVVAILIAFALRNLITTLFPRLQFIIGDNQSVVQRKRTLTERIIWDVIIVIAVSIVNYMKKFRMY